jgi:hypothetical protein
MGKTVTGVDYHPNGSFTVMASDPEKQDSATASYWDKVLPK